MILPPIADRRFGGSAMYRSHADQDITWANVDGRVPSSEDWTFLEGSGVNST